MAMASTSFLSSFHLIKHPSKKSSLLVTCCHKQEAEPNRERNEAKLAKIALVAVASGMLALGSPQDVMAAKSGGRVGGQAFRSAPRSSGPRINNSRTNIYVNPVAPPLIGGYGYGYGGYGGWGWSPFTFFAPGPSIAVGVGGGFDFFAAILVFGAIATVIRRFAQRNDDDDEDY